MGQDIASENKKIRTEEIAANMTRPERLEPLNLSKAISAVFIILGAMYPPIILVHLASSIYFYRERICKICFNNVFEGIFYCTRKRRRPVKSRIHASENRDKIYAVIKFN